MKKNDLIIITSVIIYSYLFYAQTAGVNFLLFSIVLTLLMYVKEGAALLSNKKWIAAIIGSIITGFCVAIYGNTLSVIANILSLSIAASFAVNRESSLLFASIFALYSYISSFVFIFLDAIKRQESIKQEKVPVFKGLLVSGLPIVVTIIFFLIYREANPIFKEITSIINISIFSWDQLLFTFAGFLLLYGYFCQKEISWLSYFDKNGQDNLRELEVKSEETNNSYFNIENENQSGIILFILLNTLLLFVNVIDIFYLWFSNSSSQGLTYSQIVHQGIYTLICSIILAVVIILIYFRGNLNFYKKNKAIKALAYIWIVQNAFLIITCVFKNSLYIYEYSLTYKRIGVYIYLLLSLVGLFTTFIKILKAKSNWFLFRKTSWALYFILILSCFLNWDLIIVRYNLYTSSQPDKEYLLTLSSTVLPELIKYERENKKLNESENEFTSRLQFKKEDFENDVQAYDWQSWNFEDNRVYNLLKQYK